MFLDTSENVAPQDELSDEEVVEGDGSLEDNSVDISADVEDAVTEPSSSRSTTPVSSVGTKGKKRKRSKGEVVEDVMSKVMKNVTELKDEWAERK